MLSFSFLTMNKELCKASTLLRIHTNLPKLKLEIIKLKNLSKNLATTLIDWDHVFQKENFRSKIFERWQVSA